MITREHSDLHQKSIVVFSNCENYRFLLRRVWNKSLPQIGFLMLNPSTADERINDPTIERCQRRAIVMGFGSLCIVNLFPIRSTDPNVLNDCDPYGDIHDANSYITGAAVVSDLLICAWGNHKAAKQRAKDVTELLFRAGFAKKMHCLGTNNDGSPKHPLYVPYSAPIKPWPTSHSEISSCQ